MPKPKQTEKICKYDFFYSYPIFPPIFTYNLGFISRLIPWQQLIFHIVRKFFHMGKGRVHPDADTGIRKIIFILQYKII